MKKELFKKEIEIFLAEIEARKQEVANGVLESSTQVGESLLEFARTNFKSSYPLVYSVKGVRLDVIFHLKPKNQESKKLGSKNQKSKKLLHNASNYEDIVHLWNALKYEIIANKEEYKGITVDEFYYVYWGYLTRLMRNVNWSTTYNHSDKNDFGLTLAEKKEYLPWMINHNIFSNEAIKILYTMIFINNDNTVADINGDIKEINIKNSNYNTMKKLTKDQIIDIINLFEQKPTVKEITNKYLETLDEEADDYNDKYVSKELMRHYIQDYELEDMIKINKYKK